MSALDFPQSPERQRAPLTVAEKTSYACGAVPFGLGFMALGSLAYPIFNLTLGLSATLVGAILALGRLWDALTDPAMGSISDNARTRWGRRRPFILLGGFLIALTFPALWLAAPEWPASVRFATILGTVLLFYTATTVFSVPWLSLGYELNPDPIERTRLQAWRSYFAGLMVICLPWFYRWAQADWFGDTLTGMRWLSAVCGVVVILFTLPIFFGCREHGQTEVQRQPRTPFWQGLAETAQNRAFLLLIGGIVTPMLCIPMLVGSLALYINIYHIFGGDTKTGAAYAAAFSTSLFVLKFVILPLGVRLVARYGKIRVITWVLWLGLVASLAKFFLYTPAAPWLQFVNALLLAPSITVFGYWWIR